MEPVQEEVVEESETALESSSEVQETVADVTSPSLPASPGYSNIFAFTVDDVVIQFFMGVGTGIDSTFNFHYDICHLLIPLLDKFHLYSYIYIFLFLFF